jgi:hypothetical protein
MKKIFTVAQVKNENDIIESFCRYNLTYCDGMLILDNGSIDNTVEIILKLIDEGLPITLVKKDTLKPSGMSYKTQIAHKAFDEFGADLVLPLDADEFLCHVDGINPRETLDSLDEEVEYHAAWRTYVYTQEPDITLGFMPNNFTYYRNPSMDEPKKYVRRKKVIASKNLLINKLAEFGPGAHFLSYPSEYKDSVNSKTCENLFVAHYPIRSKFQIIRKAASNWIHKWCGYHSPSRGVLDALQLGILFNELRESGEISADRMNTLSIEYAMTLDACENNEIRYTDRESLDKLKTELGQELTFAGKMNISFCSEQLNLSHTDYRYENKTLFRAILSVADKTITHLASERDKHAHKLNALTTDNESCKTENEFYKTENESYRAQNESLRQDNDNLLQQVNTLTQQSDDLTQQINNLTQQNEQLEARISCIYNSRTYKLGNFFRRFFRFFIPYKK